MVKDQNSNRRIFIRTAALATGMLAFSGTVNPIFSRIHLKSNPTRISQLNNPVAIAMWDYSWILRHHRYGEFENWDAVLDGLAERGYNAIRIDAMPQFIAADTDGEAQTEFRSVRNDWTPALWGNDYTMSFRPREALLEFLPKCEEYGIKVGLASWFLRHGTSRTEIFLEKGGLFRAWDETITFLGDNDLIKNVIYIDILNEYPNWHGYDWLKKEMNNRSDIKKFKLDNPNANVPEDDRDPNESRYNPLQRKFYNEFIDSTLKNLKDRNPEMDFFTSLDSGMDLNEINLSGFNALDYHVWFEHRGDIPGIQEVRARDQSLNYRKIYAHLTKYWKENKNSLIEWMRGRISDIAETALKNGIICGNTEGWGPIMWFDHPELDWNWTKTSGEICVDLALQHDQYKFICTSNFTHPQFKGIWDDIGWHRKMTTKIKQGG